MKKNVLFAALFVSGPVFSQSIETSVCPDGTTVCAPQTQEMGDETNTNSVDNSQSEATQLNPSANTNNSGDITTDINNKAQASTHTGDVSATGGSANGNTSDNKSSASANNSMGQSNTGNSSSSTGASNSVSEGGNVGNIAAHGGSGGSGGTSMAKGGEGGSIADSGNAQISDVGNAASRSAASGGAGGRSASNSGATGGVSSAAGGQSGGNVIDTRNQSTSVSNVSYLNMQAITQPHIPSVAQGGRVDFATQNHCGPLLERVERPIYDYKRGKAKQIGVQEIAEERADGKRWHVENIDGRIVRWGSYAVYSHHVGGVAGGFSIQLGGMSSDGNMGQGGAGFSRSRQVQGRLVDIFSCEYISRQPQIVEVVKEVVREVPVASAPVVNKPVRRKIRRINKPLNDCIDECKAKHSGFTIN